MNQPSSVAVCTSGVACGSWSVHVCQVFATCFASVPLNHVGVGGSATHGWYGPVWLATWSCTTLKPAACAASTSAFSSAMVPKCSSTP